MSSESVYSSKTPATVVPSGIDDPVLLARAELAAALAAIEYKANIPARAAEKIQAGTEKARAFAQREPVTALVAAAGFAIAVGAAVWGIARLIAR